MEGRERILLQGLPDSSDFGAVFADAYKQLVLGLDASTEKESASLRTAAEYPSFHQLVEGGYRSITQPEHDDVSAGCVTAAKAGEQFLQFGESGKRQGGNVSLGFSSHDNYM